MHQDTAMQQNCELKSVNLDYFEKRGTKKKGMIGFLFSLNSIFPPFPILHAGMQLFTLLIPRLVLYPTYLTSKNDSSCQRKFIFFSEIQIIIFYFK